MVVFTSKVKEELEIQAIKSNNWSLRINVAQFVHARTKIFFQYKLFLGSFSVLNCIKFTSILFTKRNAEITTKFVSVTHPTHIQLTHAAYTIHTIYVAP